ncbi:MAG: terminase [Pseudomonadota bacterium]
MPGRQDSDYVAHSTKGNDACANLEDMLTNGQINASRLPWNNREAVCFTECPWSSLLAHAEQYSSFGLGFAKARVFAAGGGPAYYVRNDLFGQQQWEGTNYTFVTPYWPAFRPASKAGHDKQSHPIDYLHEREWRVPHNFTFTLQQVEFVIMPDYGTMASFPQALKDGIGREKFIFMDVYRKIEDLWPVHNI